MVAKLRTALDLEQRVQEALPPGIRHRWQQIDSLVAGFVTVDSGSASQLAGHATLAVTRTAEIVSREATATAASRTRPRRQTRRKHHMPVRRFGGGLERRDTILQAPFA